MSPNPLLDVIEKVVTLHQGMAEYTDDNGLEVLLPQEVAQVLAVSELVNFTTQADRSDSYFVTYNSEVFEHLETLLQDRGQVASLGVQYDGYLKTKGFEDLVHKTLYAQNGLIRVGGAQPALTPYVLCNVSYTADADEQRLGLVSFFVNGLTGVAGMDVSQALAWASDRIMASEEEIRECLDFDQVLTTLHAYAPQLIDRELKPWRNSLQRKWGRDEKRMNTYYGTIITEIETKINRKQLEGDDRAKEEARIQATQAELQRKLTDLQDRYSLSVSAQLHSVLVVMLQTVHVSCTLVRKKQKREIVVVWNPSLKAIEPLRCEQSHQAVTRFYLQDQDAKVIAPEVWSA
jgi:hypothetical protein